MTKDFKFVAECARDCGKDAAKEESLHSLAAKVSYIDSFLRGGRLTADEAAQQVKDLYKAWKSANKAIDQSHNVLYLGHGKLHVSSH